MRQEMTPAERKLWFEYLKDATPRWRKQRPFGPYIVDFYCPELKLVIEVDGESHYTPEGQAYDAERTAYLESMGIRVLRFSNLEVTQNFAGICQHLGQTSQQPN